MHRESANGIVFYRFEGLADAGLTHAFLTRLGGVSQGPYATLNLGHTVGDDLGAVQENHRRVFALFGVGRGQVVSPYQVHGAHVRPVGREHGGTVQNGTDGLLTTTPGLMLLFRFADCVPLLLWDPVHRAVGLVHAGWRGVAGGIVRAAVDAFVRHAGSRPEDLWAGIGPAIGPCCYQVGPEVAQAVSLHVAQTISPDVAQAVSLHVAQAVSLHVAQTISPDVAQAVSLHVAQTISPDVAQAVSLHVAQTVSPDVAQAVSLYIHRRDGGLYLDLPGAVRAELEALGVRRIESSGICTACHTDEWFSHRAEGGRTGRFGALVMLER